MGDCRERVKGRLKEKGESHRMVENKSSRAGCKLDRPMGAANDATRLDADISLIREGQAASSISTSSVETETDIRSYAPATWRLDAR